MIHFSTKYRSEQIEIMDDFNLQGPEMKELLDDLRNINKRLGGNRITINAIKKLLETSSKTETITILDLGCGDGEMLRECARFGKKLGLDFQLVGLDANEFILEEAKRKSNDFQNIIYKKIDVFSEEMKSIDFDIALCTLFLHHFTNKQITDILNVLKPNARIGIVVNDLQRNYLSFCLFKIYSQFFIKTKIARHDGLISIASGFRKKEMEAICENISCSESHIKWKWAFRYQWILK